MLFSSLIHDQNLNPPLPCTKLVYETFFLHTPCTCPARTLPSIRPVPSQGCYACPMSHRLCTSVSHKRFAAIHESNFWSGPGTSQHYVTCHTSDRNSTVAAKYLLSISIKDWYVSFIIWSKISRRWSEDKVTAKWINAGVCKDPQKGIVGYYDRKGLSPMPHILTVDSGFANRSLPLRDSTCCNAAMKYVGILKPSLISYRHFYFWSTLLLRHHHEVCAV